MATLTVFSDSSDGVIFAQDPTWADVVSGSAATFFEMTANTFDGFGQDFNNGGNNEYGLEPWYGQFDTAALGAGATVTAVALSLYGVGAGDANTAFSLEARLYDWGASLTTADWLTDSQFAALTRVATFADVNTNWLAAYNTFSEDGTNFQTGLNKTGQTKLIVSTTNHASGTAPTNSSRVLLYNADQSGTSQDPKLTVTYEIAGQPLAKRFGGVPFMGAHGSGLQAPVRQWIRRASGLLTPQFATTQIWRPAHGID